MVAIENALIPRCCGNCPFIRYDDKTGYSCKSKGVKVVHDNVWFKRAKDCPLVEIGTCKDCKRSHELSGGSIVCDKLSCIDVEKDFYCADFEKRGDEND